MFKLRRRAGAAAAGSDLPYCTMCQQSIRVDAATGRCALGHRAVAPSATALTADLPPVAVAAEVADTVAPAGTEADAPAEGGYDPDSFDPYDTIVYGRSTDYDYTTGTGSPLAWDTPAATAAASPHEAALEDYATWGEPSDAFSALDVDSEQLPAVPSSVQSPGAGDSGLFDGVDDEDDATHARRKAVGTVAGTIAASGMVFAAIAALPF